MDDIMKDTIEQINKAFWKPRDRKRIKRIMKLITDIWMLSPDLRLGQLLYNYAGFSDMDHHIEDDITERILNENFEKFFKSK
jgi:uncharacterized protein YihD (DUF1040 family)